MTRRISAVVTGRAPGVAYRASTILGLTGWVRNLPDGSVELEAQGPAAQVDALLAWCAHGPPAARVSHVATTELPAVDGEARFTLR